MTCAAKIRPFPNATEVQCELGEDHPGRHESVLRNYAHPGSATKLTWADDDRRSFRGEWSRCPAEGCVLPAGHPREHAP